MLKILKYLSQVKGSVVIIVALLMLQAYCDLSLPEYTSNIVDVGIQQGGLEYATPEIISSETLELLEVFMTEDEIAYISAYYEENEEGNYILISEDQDVIVALDDIFAITMVMSSSMTELPEVEGMEAQIKEMALEARAEMEMSSDDMSASFISQKALLVLQAEYEALGVDLNKIQIDYLWEMGIKMMAFSIVMMAAAIMVGFLASRAAAKIGMSLRGRVFKKVVSFSNAEVDQYSTASLITRSTNDIQQVQQVSVMLLRMVAYAPILGIGGIVKVMTTQTGMGWIIGVAVGSIIFLVTILMKITLPKFKKMQTLVDGLNLVSREILTGLSVIRAFSRERYEEERFGVANNELTKTQLITNRTMTFMMPTMMLIMNVITVMIVWFGAKGINMGTLQVGDMMAFITYTMQIVMAFFILTMISIMLPRAGVAAGRIDEILKTEITIHDPEINKDKWVQDCKGVLTFDDVSFRYPNAEEDALSHISFTANPGETTAIIGSTGCGKSTLLHLIPRFYDVTKGKITLDGIDIRDVKQNTLCEKLGFVPQKGLLFSGNIASNIKFGGEDISDEEMEKAARIAQALDFIEEKDGQFESDISQGGSNVSGGQKQRLSIARAIAKNPKIYLFDDSFSALDYKTDITLRKALKEAISDATILIVAQRISTILHADQILVLEDGKIVGKGTHKELLKTCDAYLEIATSQLSEAELYE
ncbi:MAG: ABC transporter ATP-binding protein [Eubacteriales bacterium]